MAERFRELFLSLSDAVFIEDDAGVVIEANRAAAELLECPLEDIAGRGFSERLAPVSRERLRAQRQNLRPGRHRQFDAQMLTPRGSILSVICDVSLLPPAPEDASGGSEPPGPVFINVVRATARLDELERELRLQRQSALAGFGNILHQVFFISSRHEISPYPPLEARSGADASGDIIRPLDWVHTLLLGERLKPSVERAWRGEAVVLPAAWYAPSEGGAWHKSYSGILAAAQDAPRLEQRWLQLSFVPLRGRGGEAGDICVHVLDCTRDRVEREQARGAEMHAVAGVLGGTLQHELNNHLSVILAQAGSLRLALEPGALPPSSLGAIMDAAQNAAALLRRSVDASRLAPAALSESDLNALAADCAQFLPHLFQGRLRVETDLAAGLPLVRGDATMLHMLLLALAREAGNTAAPGGSISIRTWRGQPQYAGLPHTACIGVQADAGSGSRREALNLSAPIGAGGDSIEISLVRMIVREHRGQFEYERGGSQGRRWEVSLPGLEKALPLGDPSPAPITDSQRDIEELEEKLNRIPGGERPVIVSASKTPPLKNIEPQARRRILVADDEENFRQFVGWVLKERGYEVVTAADGQEAFEKFLEAPAAYHLVILDSYMPRMGGLESYLRMQVLRPDLPVLFASGFARGPSVDAMIDGCPGPAGVLLKPFSADDLAEAVGKALAPAPRDF